MGHWEYRIRLSKPKKKKNETDNSLEVVIICTKMKRIYANRTTFSIFICSKDCIAYRLFLEAPQINFEFSQQST